MEGPWIKALVLGVSVHVSGLQLRPGFRPLPISSATARRKHVKKSAAMLEHGFERGGANRASLEYPQVPRIISASVEITISSQYSPDLAGALVRGKLDVAFLRPETQTTNLVFKLLTKEPLVVVLPSDHRLASHEAINPQDIAGETFISVSNTAPVLRVVIDDYLRRSGIDIKPDHEADYGVNARRSVATCLRTESASQIRDQPSLAGGCTHD